MGQVFSIVSGSIAREGLERLQEEYRAGVDGPKPPGLAATWLLVGGDTSTASVEVAIATLWRDRADLDAMVATGQEPFARRLIREAGGTPSAAFFDVLQGSTARE